MCIWLFPFLLMLSLYSTFFLQCCVLYHFHQTKFLISVWQLFDNFPMGSVSTGQSECEKCGRQSWQVPWSPELVTFMTRVMMVTYQVKVEYGGNHLLLSCWKIHRTKVFCLASRKAVLPWLISMEITPDFLAVTRMVTWWIFQKRMLSRFQKCFVPLDMSKIVNVREFLLLQTKLILQFHRR